MTEQGMEDRHGLQTGLKRRHVTMIALGGVIAASAHPASHGRKRWHELRLGREAVLFVNGSPGSVVPLTLRTYTVPNVNREAADGIRLTKCTLTAPPSRGS